MQKYLSKFGIRDRRNLNFLLKYQEFSPDHKISSNDLYKSSGARLKAYQFTEEEAQFPVEKQIQLLTKMHDYWIKTMLMKFNPLMIKPKIAHRLLENAPPSQKNRVYLKDRLRKNNRYIMKHWCMKVLWMNEKYNP